jgi:hypothetical protein
MKDTFATALVKELCVLCAKEMDGPIIMTQKLTVKNAKDVRAMHGKVIGFAEKHCDNCQSGIDRAFMFIGFDKEKSDMDNLPEGFYRTGNIVGIRKDHPLVQEWVAKVNPKAFEHGFMFTPVRAMRELGLIRTSPNGHDLIQGSRGGQYYLNSKGNKTYVKW